jgi:cobalamin biosynthesis protein CbiG
MGWLTISSTTGVGCGRGTPLPLLFDSIIKVLHLMLQKAAVKGLLSDLSPRGFRHCTSMYADVVVTFLKPERISHHMCDGGGRLW